MGNRIQTIMLSATVGDALERLIKMSMRKPLRIMADPDHSTAKKLVQKIVRLREGQENMREAALLTLVRGMRTEKAIVFFRTKQDTHRFATVLTLLGYSPS